MSHELVVRGGTVVTATESTRADVGVDGGRVTALAPSLPSGRREIDAAGLLVLPGGVDVHTHLDAEVGGVRSVDDFESGTAAAACGGVTTICDYAWQARGQSLSAAVEDWKTKALGRAHIDYGFHVIVCDASDRTLAEIPRLVDIGYPSIKVFMINEFGIGDQAMVRVLRRGAEGGGGRQRARRERRHARSLHAQPARGRAPRPALLRGEPACARGGRGHPPGHRLRGAGRRRDLHRAPLVRGRARGGEPGAPARGAGVGRDAPDLPGPHRGALRGGRGGGGQVRGRAAAAHRARSGRALGGAALGRHPGHRQRQHVVDRRAEGGGGARLHAGAVRGARARDRDAGDLLRGRGQRAHLAPDLRGRVLDQSRRASSGSTRRRARSRWAATPTWSSSIRPAGAWSTSGGSTRGPATIRSTGSSCEGCR